MTSPFLPFHPSKSARPWHTPGVNGKLLWKADNAWTVPSSYSECRGGWLQAGERWVQLGG